MNYTELRQQYPNFIYHDFHIEENDSEFRITYDFEIAGLELFNPTYLFKKRGNQVFSNKKIVRELVFSLGLVECISYWKITCSPHLIIECGKLNDNQIAWWKKLYFHGLGEFFYINQIQPNFDDFITLNCVGKEIEGDILVQEYVGQLIPVGGGKDSFVSLEILKPLFEENDAFVINKVMSAIHASIAAGYEEKLVYVSRSLDARMLELNKKGYLNGHTPFSAMVAFASTLAAVLNQKKYICLSNEASANESTVLNDTVNHQYSKSYEFEKDFNEYSQQYLVPEIEYFSLLRPLSELQIAKIFSKSVQYHSVFKSCNVGSKQEIWCCHCAKCLFVYLLMAAYLEDEDCVSIFGQDMLNNEELYPILMELCGLSENKPFECVGTREEVVAAISLGIEKRVKQNKPLGILYQKYLNQVGTLELISLDEIKGEWNDEHQIPNHLLNLVKEKVEEAFYD
ncbi:hypothetical protein [Anaerorhabdus furcosa]|uniref:UDP-N-acetyl-alpha-D-muramoyl-L-alanyl-L-glutamate epimerase n=1 Tax=Anaerorhabdus furcosa TaxID=118967 RepID=A0A1T4P0F4_9FIRM|nr:hypothetical protein [Anaerorhabdus furcosa]SJZ84919.1 hypothetical protein SAMN02745191_1818 [Anaerorhabdus furcosa]